FNTKVPDFLAPLFPFSSSTFSVCYRQCSFKLRQRDPEADASGSPNSLPRSRSGEKHLLGGLAQQPIAVAVGEKIEPVADQGDRIGVVVALLHLKWAVGGPHQPLGSISVEQPAD